MKKIIILFLLCIPSAAWAGATVDDHNYSISGVTCAELKQQMKLFAPHQNEAIYDGATEWQMQSDWKYAKDGEHWKIGVAQFNLTMKYYMPNWLSRAKGELRLQQEWDRFLTGSKDHKKGHKDFGMSAAAEIEKAVLALPSAKTQEEIGQKADETARNILSQYSEKEKLYDLQTQYGTTQGAYFCQ